MIILREITIKTAIERDKMPEAKNWKTDAAREIETAYFAHTEWSDALRRNIEEIIARHAPADTLDEDVREMGEIIISHKGPHFSAETQDRTCEVRGPTVASAIHKLRTQIESEGKDGK